MTLSHKIPNHKLPSPSHNTLNRNKQRRVAANRNTPSSQVTSSSASAGAHGASAALVHDQSQCSSTANKLIANTTGVSAIAAQPSAASGPSVSAPPLIAQLRQQIRRVETSQRVTDTQTVTTGVAAIDQLLPEGGYTRGTIVEWLSPAPGCGAEWLALHTASRAAARQTLKTGQAGTIVVIDPQREFFAPAARAFGIQNDQLIIIHSAANNDLYWSIDQTLRCPAVAAVVVLGSQAPRCISATHRTAQPQHPSSQHPSSQRGADDARAERARAAARRMPALLEQVDERWLRRFQLSAEQSGALGLFVRPITVARQPSWCEVQWRVCLTRPADRNPPAQPAQLAAAPRDAAPRDVAPRDATSPAPVTDAAPLNSLSNAAAFARDADRWRSLSLQLLKCRGTAAGQQIHLAWNTHTGEVQTLRPTRWISSSSPPVSQTANAVLTNTVLTNAARLSPTASSAASALPQSEGRGEGRRCG